jgi:hypothetical protein
LKSAAQVANVASEYDAIEMASQKCGTWSGGSSHSQWKCPTVLPLENLRWCTTANVAASWAHKAGHDLTAAELQDGKVATPIHPGLQRAFEEFHTSICGQYPWYQEFLENASAKRKTLDASGQCCSLPRESPSIGSSCSVRAFWRPVGEGVRKHDFLGQHERRLV